MGCTPSNLKAADAAVPVKSVKILKKKNQVINSPENPESSEQIDSCNSKKNQQKNIQISQQDSEDLESVKRQNKKNQLINQQNSCKLKTQESKRTSVMSYQNIVMNNMQQTQSTQYNSKLGSRKSILRIDDNNNNDNESNYLTSLNELDVAQEKSILRSNMNRRKTQEPIEARKMSIIQAYQQRHSILYNNENILQQVQEQYYKEINSQKKQEINETSEQDEETEYQEQQQYEQQNQQNNIIHEMKESDTSKKTEDSIIKKSVKALLISLDSQVPKYIITEQFVKTRKKVRDMRKEEENPAPFISKDLKTSSIITRRQLLEKEINSQEKQILNQFQQKKNNNLNSQVQA